MSRLRLLDTAEELPQDIALLLAADPTFGVKIWTLWHCRDALPEALFYKVETDAATAAAMAVWNGSATVCGGSAVVRPPVAPPADTPRAGDWKPVVLTSEVWELFAAPGVPGFRSTPGDLRWNETAERDRNETGGVRITEKVPAPEHNGATHTEAHTSFSSDTFTGYSMLAPAEAETVRSFCRLTGICNLLRRSGPDGCGGPILYRRTDGGIPDEAHRALPPIADLPAAFTVLAAADPAFAADFELYYWITMLRRRRALAEVYLQNGATATLTRAPFGSLLSAVATAPERRGRGAATRLLLSLIAAEPRPIGLFCTPALTGFYTRLGFSINGYWSDALS